MTVSVSGPQVEYTAVKHTLDEIGKTCGIALFDEILFAIERYPAIYCDKVITCCKGRRGDITEPQRPWLPVLSWYLKSDSGDLQCNNRHKLPAGRVAPP